MTDALRGHANSLSRLESKEYLEVLKNTLEVPKYIVGLLAFLATSTAAISRLRDKVFGFEKAAFAIAMALTFVSILAGYRIVSHVLQEMTDPHDYPESTRDWRFAQFRSGPYSHFVKFSAMPLLAWMFCLCAMVFL